MAVNLIEAGARIKEIRQKHQYSMATFARLVGNSSASTVNNWEKGNNLPKATRLERIAILGNTTPNWIKYGDFKTYVKQLLQNTCMKEGLSKEQLQTFVQELQIKKISYEDDIQILTAAREKFPSLFEHQYEEFKPLTPLMIAEEGPHYSIEKEELYRTRLLPQIALLAQRPQQFELLITAANLLINEDADTFSFLTNKSES